MMDALFMQVMRGVWLILIGAHLAFVCGQEVQWNLINATELHSLSPDVFANINISQVRSIPFASCTGFRGDQMNAIPAECYSGFWEFHLRNIPAIAFSNISASQLGNLNAYFLTSDIIGNTSSQAAVGWTRAQTGQMLFNCRGFTAQQLANINPDAIRGFCNVCGMSFRTTALSVIPAAKLAAFHPNALAQISIPVFQNINPAAFGGWTSDQIDTWPLAFCTVITPEQFAQLSVSSFNRLKISCINATQAIVWSGLSTSMAQSMSNSVIGNLPNGALSQIPDEVLLSMSFSQVTAFRTSTINELGQGDRIYKLYSKFGMDFVDHYTPDMFSGFSPQVMVAFKAHIPGSITPFIRAPKDWSQINWIQFSLLSRDINSLPPTFWNQISTSTVGGIRVDQVRKLFRPLNFVRDIHDYQGAYLGPDTLSAMTTAQLSFIQPTVFAFIPAYSINALSLEQWQSLSLEQISNLPNTTLVVLDCTLAQGMLQSQVEILSCLQQDAYYMRLLECYNNPKAPTTSNAPPPTADSSTRRDSNTETVLVVIIALLACAVVAGGGFILWKNFQGSGLYAHLQQQDKIELVANNVGMQEFVMKSDDTR